MIVRYTLRVVLDDDFELPDFSGYIVRGIFYHLIREVDPRLAEGLHQVKRLAPFSTSPLTIEYAEDRKRGAVKKLRRGDTLLWRAALLDEGLAKRFLDSLLLKMEVKVGDVNAHLCGVSVESIDAGQLFKRAEPVRSFIVDFETPTFFRQSILRECCPFCPVDRGSCRHVRDAVRRYRFIPLPDPYLMFRNLLRLWMAFSNVPLKNHKEYIDWLKYGGVAVAGYSDLKTVRVYEHPTTPKWSVGFVGRAYFNLPEDTYAEDMAKITDTLLKFGEHSNVGGNRTAGFGCIKYKPKGDLKSNVLANRPSA